MNELQAGMRALTDELRAVSGLAVAYGGADAAHRELYGNAQEVRYDGAAFVPDVRPLAPDAVFDLASVTKLFTCIAVMQLAERGAIGLNDTLARYDRRFVHIGDATVRELLCFRAGLQTAERIDAQTDREAALNLLFAVRHAPLPPVRYYTDMDSMVLKYVVEAVSGMPFYEYLRRNVLLPLDMHTTVSRVPEALYGRLVNYNYERRIVNGAYTVDMGAEPGQPHDYKARILRGGGGDLCGHAGLFSTMGDMVRLAHGLIHDRLFSRETLLEIGLNRTGHALPGGGYTQHLGYLCFAKHPIQTYSEVPACFGARTLALNGFTGNHFSIDPEQNRFIIILANRIHNRVTFASGRPDPNDKTLSVRWDDGHDYAVSQNYTYLKDGYLKDPIGAFFARE